MSLRAELKINDFRVEVYLGVGDEERSELQWVSINMVFRFKDAPLACATDSVNESIDYFKLCELVRECITHKAFKTIEHMAREAFAAIEVDLAARFPGELTLSLRKLKPPIENLKGGSEFCLVGQL
jgi:dihydroneopterin aldolase